MTSPQPETGKTPPRISDQEWGRILRRIEDRKVIPVVGEHLTLMVRGDPPEQMSLAAYLAAELDLPGSPPGSLDELAVRYLQKNPRGLDDLYTDVSQVLTTSESFPIPTPLKQLAEIRHLDLFINTSFDPYMTLALNEVRFGRRSSGSTRILSYERNRAVDIPLRYRELDYPLVYHLFGRAQAAPIFAVTDEDVLEFMHTLQAPECQPPNLSDALRQQHLLILGTRLIGWLTRFFLRVSSADRLRNARKSDYLVDPATDSDTDQALFFEHFGSVKLLPVSAVSFIEELSRRWKDRHPDNAVPETAPIRAAQLLGVGEVFLSYASEDLGVVKDLRERLEREAGVHVWLDKDSLRGGDQWERCIADTLRRCAVCVPVVSASVKAGSFRYVRAEWKEAVRLQAGKPANRKFILPLLIDDTRPDDAALDPDIRAIHWHHLKDEEEMRQFLAAIRAQVTQEPRQ